MDVSEGVPESVLIERMRHRLCWDGYAGYALRRCMHGVGVLAWSGCVGMEWVCLHGVGVLAWSGCVCVEWGCWHGVGVLAWSGGV